MDLRLYVLLIPLTFNTYLRRNKNNEPSMAFRFYFLLIPLTFNLYLRKNIDHKSFMDPRASRSLKTLAKPCVSAKPPILHWKFQLFPIISNYFQFSLGNSNFPIILLHAPSPLPQGSHRLK